MNIEQQLELECGVALCSIVDCSRLVDQLLAETRGIASDIERARRLLAQADQRLVNMREAGDELERGTHRV